ncbi:MAG: thioredoxin domain-containing protein [Nitrospiraceae bacterium]|nr:thioredoxin domain-containing protein [Nitrospiraceae bacterium]
MNRLAREKSPYLRHAAEQEIDWYPWCDEAFERARQENKPVFLSTGAIWCHWCHVMARECFEDKEVARMLNERFISVKLDRDERPDIDRRYQRAVSAMGSGGGWPLSVFLTPERKPFFGGTYFPPEDRQGRAGFKKVLGAVYEFFMSRRGEIDQYAERLIEALRGEGPSAGEITLDFVDRAESLILSQFDPENGGFGSAPKFPAPGAVEFLLNRYFFGRREAPGYAVTKTLEAMAKGGIHDQIGGGFHRYSTDEAWIVPHFEKMADDNAWLLRNFLNAYSLFGSEYFKTVAEGIIRFFLEVLSDPRGGFYGSQDADVTLEDEGGYFIWRDEDLRGALDEEEYKVMSLHLFHERGRMPHDSAKRVLFVAMEPPEIAVKTGYAPERVLKTIGSARAKLLGARNSRVMPFVDRVLYSGLNGTCISAFLVAFRTLGDKPLKEFALKSLDRILREHFAGDELLHAGGIKGVFDDYANVTAALIDAYEVTAHGPYLDTAERLADLGIAKFWDEGQGGFRDTDEEVLGIRMKPVEDIPHPSANSVGIMQLLRLHFLTGKDDYYRRAEEGLKTFSGTAADLGIHAGYFHCAVDAYFNIMKLSVGAASGSELAERAVHCFRPYKTLAYSGEKGSVTPCLASGVCLEPIYEVKALEEFLSRPL